MANSGGFMRRLSKTSTIIIALAMTFAFIACKNQADDSSEPEQTYTVWTDTTSYDDFYAFFGQTISDGYYIRNEISPDDWKQIYPSLTSDGKHNWTQDKIKDWFIGRGFGEKEAEKESAWIATIDHGILAARTQSKVYLILK